MKGMSTIHTGHNSVNCDRPGECSPEKDCLR